MPRRRKISPNTTEGKSITTRRKAGSHGAELHLSYMSTADLPFIQILSESSDFFPEI